ncbi:MAG: tetratricopeptide repeat protein [Spirochaetes bacterium]|nr:tetratricopeptide repeat protein [Spirochaetota bacterium]
MRIIIIALTLVMVPAVSHTANEKNGDRSLEALADDLKFQNGMSFINLKMYDKAIETFNEYLEIYYNGNHRHEAYRQLAGIYFGRLEYLKAIDNYRALYEEFSNTESGIEAYYNVGICYNKMGNDKKAAEIFNDIIESHPDSSYVQQAKLQLDLMNILEE